LPAIPAVSPQHVGRCRAPTSQLVHEHPNPGKPLRRPTNEQKHTHSTRTQTTPRDSSSHPHLKSQAPCVSGQEGSTISTPNPPSVRMGTASRAETDRDTYPPGGPQGGTDLPTHTALRGPRPDGALERERRSTVLLVRRAAASSTAPASPIPQSGGGGRSTHVHREDLQER